MRDFIFIEVVLKLGVATHLRVAKCPKWVANFEKKLAENAQASQKLGGLQDIYIFIWS